MGIFCHSGRGCYKRRGRNASQRKGCLLTSEIVNVGEKGSYIFISSKTSATDLLIKVNISKLKNEGKKEVDHEHSV